MGNSQSGARPAATLPDFQFSNSGVFDTTSSVCNAEPLAIQYALQQMPEFKNQYTIKIKDIANIPDNNLQCDVNYIYSSAETGFTKNERRRITFKLNDEGEPVIDSISQRLNELLESSSVSPKEVLDYYTTLKKYNENWIASGWKMKDASYNPPMPLWDDPIFIRNIEIYNKNYKNVINTIRPVAFSATGVELFKKWIAPVPAEPMPPKATKVLLPLKPVAVAASGSDSSSAIDEAAIENALAVESESAIKNAEAIAEVQIAYNRYNIPTNSPLYDPPIEGDNYETVLVKLIKAYEYATSEESAKQTASFFSGSRDAVRGDNLPSPYNRRLIGRVLANNSLQKFMIPEPILPPNYNETIDYSNSIGYNFNERQRYLIDYAPIEDSERPALRANFCKSLGFQPNTEQKCGNDSDCCAQLQNLPKYSGSAAAASASASASASLTEPFASASSSHKKCGHSGIQLGGRTLTVSVPAPPVNIDTSNRMFTYKMSRPTNGTCKPAPLPKPSPDELYNALRPSLLKELQENIKNNKMFDLRCPGSCL